MWRRRDFCWGLDQTNMPPYISRIGFVGWAISVRPHLFFKHISHPSKNCSSCNLLLHAIILHILINCAVIRSQLNHTILRCTIYNVIIFNFPSCVTSCSILCCICLLQSVPNPDSLSRTVAYCVCTRHLLYLWETARLRSYVTALCCALLHFAVWLVSLPAVAAWLCRRCLVDCEVISCWEVC